MDAEPSKVILVPPSQNWIARAKAEADRFATALGENLVEVHHIGSTAIPGIWAKPVIDLIPEVRDISQLDDIENEIQSAGYQFWGEYGLPGRRFCPRVDPEKGRVANIHCYQTGAEGMFRHLAFRDYLRAHPALASEYEQEKLRARDLHPQDVQAYNDQKDPWIRRVEKDALVWARQGDQ